MIRRLGRNVSELPRRGDDFARGYTPVLGDVVHLDWAPSQGREMKGSHYALVLSADLYNVATGLAVVWPVPSKVGKLSDFEFPVRAGRVNGAAILSELRSLDYQARSIQYEGRLPPAAVAEANRRVRMIFP
jgi:mRNA interferase MazF